MVIRRYVARTNIGQVRRSWLVFFRFRFSIVFCTVVAVYRPSWRPHRMRLFFHPLNATEHGSPPPLTTCDRELVSVLEERIEPGDLNPRPLTPQSVTLRTGVHLSTNWCAPLCELVRNNFSELTCLVYVLRNTDLKLHRIKELVEYLDWTTSPALMTCNVGECMGHF